MEVRTSRDRNGDSKHVVAAPFRGVSELGVLDGLTGETSPLGVLRGHLFAFLFGYTCCCTWIPKSSNRFRVFSTGLRFGIAFDIRFFGSENRLRLGKQAKRIVFHCYSHWYHMLFVVLVNKWTRRANIVIVSQC